METFVEWLQQNPFFSPGLLTNLAASALLVLLLFLVRPVVMAIVSRRSDDAVILYRWRKITEYASLLLALVGLSSIWLRNTGSLATYLGLLSAGLAIALQDPIANLVGWAFILLRRPFEVGDRIQIGEQAGDVVDIRFFLFTMVEIRNWVDADQSTGRLLQVPNKKVFSDPLANYTQGFRLIWHEIPVLITFESDWRRAKTLLHEIVERRFAPDGELVRESLRKAARRHMVLYENITPIVYTKVMDSGVLLTLRYLTEPRQRRNSEQDVWEAVLDAFAAEPRIEFAYPTQRLYYQAREGAAPAEDVDIPG